jgi:hypothetical protein
MEKRKLLSVVLFCLCFAGITLADEVINVDLNAQGDANAYTGEGAIAGETVWRAIYQGTGVAVGSARTAGLADYDEPNKISVYAAQVWLAIPVTAEFNKENAGATGNKLMDDGFRFVAGTPYISILGEPQDGTLSAGAYNGTYDIYVYCSEPTTVTCQTTVNYGSQDVTVYYAGDADGPIPPTSYVVFHDVVIDDGNNVVPGDANTVTIAWTKYLGNGGIINGITLVKKKTPFQIDASSWVGDTMVLDPRQYDVARETNGRGGETEEFGPDFATLDYYDPCDPDPNYSGPALSYLDNTEYLIFDIACSDGNDGLYSISAYVVPVGTNSASMSVYYYNDAVEEEMGVGTLSYTNGGEAGEELHQTNELTFNIFKGSGYLKVAYRTIYYNLVDVNMYNVDTPPAMPDCNEVYKYKYNYGGDFTEDCHVNNDDLDMITEHWAECYSVDGNDCL